MTLAATRDYFEMFQLPHRFRIDVDWLDRHYQEIQARVHPDKAAHLDDSGQRVFLHWATTANEAYRTLKRPLDRARYLLRIQGMGALEESNTVMPGEFLLEQMEWREELEEAVALRDSSALENLAARLRAETDRLYDLLATLLDVQHSLPAAVDVVRQLAFLDRLACDLDRAAAELEE